jgi:hypothetical protein
MPSDAIDSKPAHRHTRDKRTDKRADKHIDARAEADAGPKVDAGPAAPDVPVDARPSDPRSNVEWNPNIVLPSDRPKK